MKATIQTATFIMLIASRIMAEGVPTPEDKETPSRTHLSYSSILVADGWDPRQLKEAGITVRRVDPYEIGVSFDDDNGGGNGDKEANLVEISFDCSKRPKKQIVRMILQVIGEDGKTLSLHHTGRTEGTGNELKMTFHVHESTLKHSYLTLHILKHPAKDDGNLEFVGYSLRLARMVELARKDAPDKAIDKK